MIPLTTEEKLQHFLDTCMAVSYTHLDVYKRQNAYNANQAYHMLSQEVYTFANDYRNAQRGTRPAQSARSAQSGTRQAQGSRQPQNARRQAPSSSTRSRRRQPQRRAGFTVYDLLKLLVPVLCIILLLSLIHIFCLPSPVPSSVWCAGTAPSVFYGSPGILRPSHAFYI